MSGPKVKLATCLLNISEARNKAVINKVIEAAKTAIETNGKPGAAVLNAFVDPEYNRSVITISGHLPDLETAVIGASKEAFALINMQNHEGGHPRLGSVDLIPIHPITEETSLEDCGVVATNISRKLVQVVNGSSFFFFGHADAQKRGLIQRRREIGWFDQTINASKIPDSGKFVPRFGITGVGAAPYMSNFNISLDTQDMAVGKEVLKNIRERSGGLVGVSGMAFPHLDGLEVACNVDMFEVDAANDFHKKHLEAGTIEIIMGTFWRTKFEVIEKVVEKVAGALGVKVSGESIIIGFTPEKARELTLNAIHMQKSSLVTSLSSSHM
eukprot:GFUD01028846.1.p1 GENE.GFUD01028846.1~~GFUD01028846.1.p1  ORF type:complete len:327 (-),score=45.41 GFUD01028846.1:162-1142(-)